MDGFYDRWVDVRIDGKMEIWNNQVNSLFLYRIKQQNIYKY